MKKAWLLVLILAFTIVSIAGCQSTPDDPVVIQKDLEQMIEKAQATPEAAETPGISLREQTDAPETLKDNSTQNNVTVAINAKVDVPDSNEISIIRVKESDFSQETVTSLWNELIGDTPMLYTSNEMTKSEIEAAIVFSRGRLEQTEDEESAEIYQKKINYLNSIYDSAPEEHEQMAVDDQLQELYITTDGSDEKTAYTGIKATSMDGNIRFDVTNSYESFYGKITQSGFRYDKSPNEDTEEDGEPNIETYDVDLSYESALENAQGLNLSPSDAEKQVEAFLSAADVPFVARSAYLKKSDDRCYYACSCVREVGDIPCAQIMGGTYSEDEAEYIETWEYESLSICIDDSGITSVIWEYPIEVIEAVVDDSTIKEFTDIHSIFDKMMFVTYEFQAKNTEELICEIVDIKLELMRINERDAQRAGLLVPVWTF